MDIIATVNSLYQIICSLCAQKEISLYRLCKEINISSSVLSDLKSGRKKSLNTGTLHKITLYFDISMDQLIPVGIKKDPPDNKTESDDKNKLIAEFIDIFLKIPENKHQTVMEYLRFLAEQK